MMDRSRNENRIDGGESASPDSSAESNGFFLCPDFAVGDISTLKVTEKTPDSAMRF